MGAGPKLPGRIVESRHPLVQVAIWRRQRAACAPQDTASCEPRNLMLAGNYLLATTDCVNVTKYDKDTRPAGRPAEQGRVLVPLWIRLIWGSLKFDYTFFALEPFWVFQNKVSFCLRAVWKDIYMPWLGEGVKTFSGFIFICYWLPNQFA